MDKLLGVTNSANRIRAQGSYTATFTPSLAWWEQGEFYDKPLHGCGSVSTSARVSPAPGPETKGANPSGPTSLYTPEQGLQYVQKTLDMRC